MVRDVGWFFAIVGTMLVMYAIMKELLIHRPKVEYRFLPRDMYYDQFFTNRYKTQYQPLFDR